MKKLFTLKTFVILSGISFGLLLIFLLISANRPEEFGKFLLGVYEDITSEYGHTVNGLFRVLNTFLTIFTAVNFVLHEILIIIAINKAGAVVDEKEEEIEIMKEKKKFKFFKFGKREKEAVKDAAEIGRNIVDSAKEATTEQRTNKPLNRTTSDFINSLKNKR